MKALKKLLFISIAISLAFAVLGCSYIASTSMAMEGHEMVSVDHVDHASSLILAIIPVVLMLLVLVCASLFIWLLESPSDILLFQSFVYESPPVLALESFRYLFNPRSPPAR